MPNDNTQKPTMSPTFNDPVLGTDLTEAEAIALQQVVAAEPFADSKLSREQAPARVSALDISPVELQQLNEFGSLIATDKFVVKTVELDDRKVQILEGMQPTPTDEVGVDFGMTPVLSSDNKLTPTPTPTPKPQIEADADDGAEEEEAKNFEAANSQQSEQQSEHRHERESNNQQHTSRAEDAPQRFISQDDFNGLTPRQQEQLRFLAAEMTASLHPAINAINVPTPALESKPAPKSAPSFRSAPKLAPSLRSAHSPKPNTAENAKRPSIFDTIRAKASVSMGAIKTAAPGITRDASAMGKKLGAAIEAAMQPWAISSSPGIPMSKQGMPGGLKPPNQSNLNVIRSDVADDRLDREDEIHDSDSDNDKDINKPKIKPKRMTM